ncbi:MAG TPA: hypothetical protein DF613_11845 [Lachnospiraceae bacterium]|nr:hypothetical protein [Lachnospiraceae bacterium]
MKNLKKACLYILCAGLFLLFSVPCRGAQEQIQAGLVEENGSYRYYQDGQALKNQWKRLEENKRKYYFGEDGAAVVGSHKIGDKYYVFNARGQLLEPSKTKFVTANNRTYYVNSKGNPVSGWQIVKGELYYITKKGLKKTDVVYDGITLGKTGAARVNTASRLKMKVMEVVSEITTPEMSRKEKLRACFDYTISSEFRYDRRTKWPNVKKKGWQKKCALDMLETHRGVCFGYACAFAALADELGYTPYLIDANLHSRHCFVRIDKKYYDKLTNSFGAKKYPRKHKILGITKF